MNAREWSKAALWASVTSVVAWGALILDLRTMRPLNGLGFIAACVVAPGVLVGIFTVPGANVHNLTGAVVAVAALSDFAGYAAIALVVLSLLRRARANQASRPR